MILEDGNVCEHISKPIRSEMTMNVITACVVCPMACVFAAHFNYLLWLKHKQEKSLVKDPLVPMVVAFNTLTGVCSINVLWLFVFEVVRQTQQSVSLTYCSAFDFFTWVLYVVQYIAMQRILLGRLDFVFSDSLVSIPSWILRSFDVLHLISLATVLIGVSIRAAHSCLFQFHNSGIFVRSGFIAEYSVCYAFVQPTVAIGGGSVVVLGNGLLLWLYVSRLRKALFLGDPSSRETVRKSALIAIASIITTLLSVIGIINGILVLPAVDFYCNMLLLYMLYSFGTRAFECVFRPFFWIIDSWIPLSDSMSSVDGSPISPTELSIASDFGNSAKRHSHTAIYSVRMSQRNVRNSIDIIPECPGNMELTSTPVNTSSDSPNSTDDGTPVALKALAKLTDLVNMPDFRLNLQTEQDTPTQTGSMDTP